MQLTTRQHEVQAFQGNQPYCRHGFSGMHYPLYPQPTR